jgi:hypothetical protein
MSPPTDEQAVINEATWQAWLEKGKRSEQATARKFKVVAGIVVPLLALGIAYFLSFH